VQQSLVALEVDQAIIVGLSMGGYIAFRLLECFPNLARALVLADTRATPDHPEQVKNRLALADRVEREGMTWLAESNIVNLVAESPDQDVPRHAPRRKCGWCGGSGPCDGIQIRFHSAARDHQGPNPDCRW
jgi:pimeloyl-ACP methyl ester carboxylesterase